MRISFARATKWPKSSREPSTSCSISCATSDWPTSISTLNSSAGQSRWHRRRVGRGRGDLAAVARSAGLEFVMDPGGGAFYGPKISVQARDAIGRTHQMSTIQLDFQTPSVSTRVRRCRQHAPAADHDSPCALRVCGAFLAILIEHYAGNMPTWLCPEQVRVLGVRDDHDDYAVRRRRPFAPSGLRVSVEEASEPLGARIAGPSSRRSPTSWWSATTTWKRDAWASMRAAPTTPSGVSSASFATPRRRDCAHGSPEGP